MKLNGIATNLYSNPYYSYIAVTFKNGYFTLLTFCIKLKELEPVLSIELSNEELSSIHFFANENDCIVSSYPNGQLYYVNVSY